MASSVLCSDIMSRDFRVAIRSLIQRPVAGGSVRCRPGDPVYRVRCLRDVVSQQTSTARFGAVLLGAFSLGALLLAGIGLYGLVAYVVGLSRREIAVRLALGANGQTVVRLIVSNGLTLGVAGLAIGVAGAMAAGCSLETQMFRTTATDPGTYGTVAATLLLVSFMASVIPARRAVRVDPHAALRAN